MDCLSFDFSPSPTLNVKLNVFFHLVDTQGMLRFKPNLSQSWANGHLLALLDNPGCGKLQFKPLPSWLLCLVTDAPWYPFNVDSPGVLIFQYGPCLSGCPHTDTAWTTLLHWTSGPLLGFTWFLLENPFRNFLREGLSVTQLSSFLFLHLILILKLYLFCLTRT